MRRKRDQNSAEPRPKGTPGAIRVIGPRVIKLLSGHKQTLIVGFLALAAGAGVNLLFPYLIREVLNEQLGVRLAQDLPAICIGLIALFALQSIFFYIRHYCFWVIGYRVVAKLRAALFSSMMRQDVSYFDTARSGDLLSRLTSDAEVVQRAMTVNVSVSVRYIIQVIGGLVLMVLISPRLTLGIVFLIPLIVLSSMFWGKRLRALSRKMQNQLGEANVIAEESISGLQTVRLFAGSAYEASRYDAAVGEALSTGEKRTAIAAVFSSSMVFLIHSAIACVLWYGGTLILAGALSIGDLTAFILYCVIVAISFGFLANTWDDFMQAIGAGERIFEVIDNEPLVTPPAAPKDLPAHKAGSVLFDAVSFAYPSRVDVGVLNDISFEIAEGSTVAFVGTSGAGKSTIANLIPRFYDPQAGSIYYCAVPLREIDPDALRAEISVVPQDPRVFSVSIRENIAYGKIGASDDEIIDAAKAANIHDFIAGLPDGYDALVGDRGIQLSGGQRQRVAIARALIKDPKFLILDEATSSLDSENEHLVQQALEHLMQGRTTMIIAHRLSTVKHADLVIVLEEGRITQTGTHASLVKTPGLYQTLVEHQLLQA